MESVPVSVPVVAVNDFFHCSRKAKNSSQVIVKNLTLQRETVISFHRPIERLLLKKQNDGTFLLKGFYQAEEFNCNLSTMFTV